MVYEWDAYYPRDDEPFVEHTLVSIINMSLIGMIEGDMYEFDRSLEKRIKRLLNLDVVAHRFLLSRNPEILQLTVTVRDDQYIVTSDYSKTPDWWDPT
jgi:hypothetical protein